MKGRITRTYPDKAFGFIKGADGQDYFFYKSSIITRVINGQKDFEDYVRVGGKVDFTPTDTEKGPRAEEVFLEDG